MNHNPRADPSIWSLGWHVMRRQGEAIRALLAHRDLQLRDLRVLDFGCGSRPYESWFKAAGASYAGADIDARHEVKIREDGALEAADGSYGMVASFQVLEHVWDTARYLGEAHRVLRSEGWLLLSTHGSWFYHPHPGDYRRWTAEGLRREVESNGFELVALEPVVGPLAWTSILRSYGVAFACRRLPLVGAALEALATLFYNVRSAIEDRITPREVTANNACVYVGLYRRLPEAGKR
ncbi:MAG TPA: class I SAM-dependent methyltransferase [Burkholderiales bacterium]|jgi:SAM-dependent methyltransferase|nr:class I SAM-dependent methyltransferase [Burkholderiales bacterium]